MQMIMRSESGVDFNVQTRGANPRAVFVHGFAGDLHTWDSVWTALGSNFAALRYDLRGCGASVTREPAPFRHADDLLFVLDAFGIDCCDLIGVSMGGGIALNFALDHPQRVENLVLVSPHLVGWEWSASWLALWNPIVQHARAGKLAEARRLWWEHPLFETTRASVGRSALYESIMHVSREQLTDDQHEPMLPDLERLHLLTTRTLLISGGRDLEEFRLIANLIKASACHLECVDEPERGHLLHLEDPQACARRIDSFLFAHDVERIPVDGRDAATTGN
jgi:pimeloyl-ACP methyl ester carboxylesterase